MGQRFSPLPISVSKVLLAHSLARPFMYGPWLVSRYNAELRDRIAHKARNIYNLALYENGLRTQLCDLQVCPTSEVVTS